MGSQSTICVRRDEMYLTEYIYDISSVSANKILLVKDGVARSSFFKCLMFICCHKVTTGQSKI